MTRPALSALRAIEIIDFMSQAPSQAYTLSELVRHTGTNVASMHAILNVLMLRGYLLRHPVHKTYRLSPALAAIGEAVAASEPMLGHARAAAEGLAKRTGLEVTVMARTGEDAICLFRVADSPLLRTSMRIGQRITLRPPLGWTYYAWSGEEEVEAWIARRPGADPDRIRASLEIVRARGYLITLRSPAEIEVRTVLTAADGGRAKSEREVVRALEALEQRPYQLEIIEPQTLYDADIITAPVFDHAGQPTYSMTLGGFSGPVSGAELLRLADRLLEACGDVMRDSDVPAARRRAS
jgi:DNA-binding IclR family transcriptional regulator